MPRHDRAYGRWHSPSSKATSTRRSRSAKNTYAAKQYRSASTETDRQ